MKISLFYVLIVNGNRERQKAYFLDLKTPVRAYHCVYSFKNVYNCQALDEQKEKVFKMFTLKGG